MLAALLYAAPITAVAITAWTGFLGWRFYVTEILGRKKEEN